MKERGRYLLLYWGPVMGMCTLIFVQSSFRTPAIIPDVSHLDKLLHVTAYAILAALFLRAYERMRIFRDRPVRLLAVSIISAVLYGLSDEIHQAFVSVRRADILDWTADGVGSIIGAALYLLMIIALARRRLAD